VKHLGDRAEDPDVALVADLVADDVAAEAAQALEHLVGELRLLLAQVLQDGAHVGGLGAEQGRLEQRLLDGPVGLLAEHAQDGALEERVGVVHGGHLRGGDDDLLRADQEEVERVVGHARAHVQDHHGVDRAQLADEALLVGVRDVGGAQHRAAAGEQAEVGDGGGAERIVDVVDRSLEQRGHAGAGPGHAEEEVLVGGAQVEIDQHHVLAQLSDGHRQVGGDDALAHAALSATDADDLCHGAGCHGRHLGGNSGHASSPQVIVTSGRDLDGFSLPAPLPLRLHRPTC